MTPLERAADAAWTHLETYDNNGDPAYASREISVVDGTVDMLALVRAVIAAIRKPSEEMARAGLAACGGDGSVLDGYEAMIDALLEEGK